ncbi:hypothetical protein Poly51_30970 [Rubripirellula tenax]|uniref:Uncharacterized protein n=1 Tax=Rubripirellula tenax TaxID=2528015 RepID=A0A5C6F1D3_9BACT|nr:hypothetical protein Poly51_30970 [Rubripirellula tenax]
MATSSPQDTSTALRIPSHLSQARAWARGSRPRPRGTSNSSPSDSRSRTFGSRVAIAGHFPSNRQSQCPVIPQPRKVQRDRFVQQNGRTKAATRPGKEGAGKDRGANFDATRQGPITRLTMLVHATTRRDDELDLENTDGRVHLSIRRFDLRCVMQILIHTGVAEEETKNDFKVYPLGWHSNR